MTEDLDQLSDAEFRSRFRSALETMPLEEFRRPFDRLNGDELRRWNRMIYESGWRAPGWPSEFGGLGVSITKQIIYQQELDRQRIARVLDIGITMVGPALMHWGTDAQRARYLPAILKGENCWCQGFSEPNAGSDLASLSTEAVLDGEDFVVSGQKIWTTHAANADYCALLVRTSMEDRKQKGITCLIVDMKAAGVSVRPIYNLSGKSEFCQMFFDRVRVPSGNALGDVGQGWTVSKGLLGPERLFIGNPNLPELCIVAFERSAAALGKQLDPAYQVKRAKLRLRLHGLQSMFKEVGDSLSRGLVDYNDLSILKIVASSLYQDAAQAALEILGERAAEGTLNTAFGLVDAKQLYFVSRPATIYGGTNEIQKNIVARTIVSASG